MRRIKKRITKKNGKNFNKTKKNRVKYGSGKSIKKSKKINYELLI